MPNPIPPNLDPKRFNHLDPLVFGEFNASGNLGWIVAISNITGYYLQQAPFDNFLGDRSELEATLLEAWKENIEQELVENSAFDLARFIIQALVVITNETVEGLEPPTPVEGEPPIDITPPGEPPDDEIPSRDTFPPVVTPVEGRPEPDRRPEPEPEKPPEDDTDLQRQPRPTPDGREPDLDIDIPVPSVPSFTPLPRDTEQQIPRDRTPPDNEGVEEPIPRDQPEPENGNGNGDNGEDKKEPAFTFDYGALENAIFNAMRRLLDSSISKPGKTIVESEPAPIATQTELLTEIKNQVETFTQAGTEISREAKPLDTGTDQNIFTIPGE